MHVSVTNLHKNFDSDDGEVAALSGVSFGVEQGQFYTLLGPSGCGKSTTLRCIAGLEVPDGGDIRIGETTVAGPGLWLPTNQRPIGMVFQSYAIWPHMTVFNNVAFPLKQRRSRVPAAERRKRVMEALELVQMQDLAHRPAPYLSGGQQQRVALARALVSRPDVLLLDEPLSNLDAKLREELRGEIKDLTKRIGMTTLYVTHDQIEALAMSDRIAVMYNGRILQEGNAREIYLSPATAFVAGFMGHVNFIDGTVAEAAGGTGVVKTDIGALKCPVPAALGAGAAVTVSVRPDCVTMTRGGGADGANVLEGAVNKAVFLGDNLECEVAVGGGTLRARVTQAMELSPGEKVSLGVPPEACIVFKRDT
jgi:iron(III) transport system ATP-binding protein